MARSYEDLVAEARSQTRQVSPEEVHEALRSGEDITVVDVREPKEWSRGHIPEAKHIPRGVLEYRVASDLPERDARVVVHCAAGGRGALAARTLQEMGYTNATNMEGGLAAWREKSYELG
ncbi:Sulfurtransferase [Rubrobacter xylanophilus DSM 9941]|uniref:rhodanese-like domain-containing protein n=1 Tax=Rubrobacter xylanophilus TaxID=49319 RepID=UPI001C63E605|nr:rhodanese-like domain-containing protein [Rubrobacter xylanophilus]QYJ15673.1 Sulfurtransferase [Rubrobacter xylanophilus DSM 9941]